MRSFPRGNPRTTLPRKDLSESPGIPLRITVGLLRVFGNEDSGLQFVKQYLFVHFDSSSAQFPYPQPLFPPHLGGEGEDATRESRGRCVLAFTRLASPCFSISSSLVCENLHGGSRFLTVGDKPLLRSFRNVRSNPITFLKYGSLN
jgi:hypothetical protein